MGFTNKVDNDETIMPDIDAMAKQTEREKLIKLLSENITKTDMFAVFSTVNNLPFSFDEGGVIMFTDKETAKEKTHISGCVITEIEGKNMPAFLDECYVCGYNKLIIDSDTEISLEEIYTKKEDKFYGKINPQLRAKLIMLNQAITSLLFRAKQQNKPIEQELAQGINLRIEEIISELENADLIFPAQIDQNDPKKASFKIPMVKLKNGEVWAAFFTDQFAYYQFANKKELTAAARGILKDSYTRFTADKNIAGFVINPNRESFKLAMPLLKQHFDKTENADA